MRTLRADDIFPFIRMINKIGLKNEIEYISNHQNDEDISDIDILMLIIEKAAENNVENEIYKFMARLFECTEDELRKKDLFEFLEDTIKIVSIDKWKAFFQSVASILKKKS